MQDDVAADVAQVIKAHVEKQRRTPSKIAKGSSKVEVGAVWGDADPDGSDQGAVHAGLLVLDLPKERLPLATAAPGVN